jgi:hypothetical protein
VNHPAADFNTRGGEIGFVVTLANGVTYTEKEITWAELPQEPIKSLSIVHFPTGHEYVVAKNYSAYYFANEATTGRGNGLSQHTAKIIGFVHPLGAEEARMEFGGLTFSKRQRHFDKPPWRASDIRPGV